MHQYFVQFPVYGYRYQTLLTVCHVSIELNWNILLSPRRRGLYATAMSSCLFVCRIGRRITEVSFPVKNFTSPVKFMLLAVAYCVAHKRATFVVDKC